MAVYLTLAIDCGKSHDVAVRIGEHFRGFQIKPPGVEPVSCDVWIEEKGGFWMVTVWPVGLGVACPKATRPEITTPEIKRFIEHALHAHLSVLTGYRAALFGDEAQDYLELSESPTEDELAVVGMIYDESLVTGESLLNSQPTFSAGYKWIPE